MSLTYIVLAFVFLHLAEQDPQSSLVQSNIFVAVTMAEIQLPTPPCFRGDASQRHEELIAILHKNSRRQLPPQLYIRRGEAEMQLIAPRRGANSSIPAPPKLFYGREEEALTASVKTAIALVASHDPQAWTPYEYRSDVEDFLSLLADLEHVALIVTLRGSERPRQVRWTRPLLHTLDPLTSSATRDLFLDISDVAPDDPGLDELLAITENLPGAITRMAGLAAFEGCTSLVARWKKDGPALFDEGIIDEEDFHSTISPYNRLVEETGVWGGSASVIPGKASNWAGYICVENSPLLCFVIRLQPFVFVYIYTSTFYQSMSWIPTPGYIHQLQRSSLHPCPLLPPAGKRLEFLRLFTPSYAPTGARRDTQRGRGRGGLGGEAPDVGRALCRSGGGGVVGDWIAGAWGQAGFCGGGRRHPPDDDARPRVVSYRLLRMHRVRPTARAPTVTTPVLRVSTSPTPSPFTLSLRAYHHRARRLGFEIAHVVHAARPSVPLTLTTLSTTPPCLIPAPRVSSVTDRRQCARPPVLRPTRLSARRARVPTTVRPNDSASAFTRTTSTITGTSASTTASRSPAAHTPARRSSHHTSTQLHPPCIRPAPPHALPTPSSTPVAIPVAAYGLNAVEKTLLFQWLMGPAHDDHLNSLRATKNSCLRECAAEVYRGKQTYQALKDCYERNFNLFKQIYSFESFHARGPITVHGETDRLRQYDRRFGAARRAGQSSTGIASAGRTFFTEDISRPRRWHGDHDPATTKSVAARGSVPTPMSVVDEPEIDDDQTLDFSDSPSTNGMNHMPSYVSPQQTPREAAPPPPTPPLPPPKLPPPNPVRAVAHAHVYQPPAPARVARRPGAREHLTLTGNAFRVQTQTGKQELEYLRRREEREEKESTQPRELERLRLERGTAEFEHNKAGGGHQAARGPCDRAAKQCCCGCLDQAGGS
ncbi:hypothetical protein C8J57DRAFT_1470733 [Mycena rebaudengoi]|nr:hypothetical protein C8J57DRAFT_1470733 [Mycena rebaudengoi]